MRPPVKIGQIARTELVNTSRSAIVDVSAELRSRPVTLVSSAIIFVNSSPAAVDDAGILPNKSEGDSFTS